MRNAKAIPATTEKFYIEVKGLSGLAAHSISLNDTPGTAPAPGAQHELQARYALAWYKLHLEGDKRYEAFLYGDKQTKDAFSRYENVRP